MARDSFAADLDAITIHTAELADDVRAALATATTALIEGDPVAAQQAVTIEARISEGTEELEQRCTMLLARQAPVADDLRLVVSLIRLAAELERSAHLAGHIARTVAHIDSAALPGELRELIAVISERVGTVYGLAITAFRSRDRELTAAIRDADDRVDESVRDLVELIVAAGRSGSIDAAEVVRLGLLSRYLERISDHAVTMSTRTLFILGVDRDDDRDDVDPSIGGV